MIDTCVISLEDSVARRQSLESEGFPKDLVRGYMRAVDLRGAGVDECARYCDLISAERLYGRPLRNSEIGCAASHRLCYQHMLSSGIEMGLIFEDDNQLAVANAFELAEKYKSYLSGSARSGQAFICNLGMAPTLSQSLRHRTVFFRTLGEETELRRYADVVSRAWQSNAYLISKAAMERILQIEPSICLLTDDWSHRLWHRTFDAIYYPKIALFRQNKNLGTTVQHGTELPPLTAPASVGSRNLMKSVMYRVTRCRIYAEGFFPAVLKECS